jgi:hypothetical protein
MKNVHSITDRFAGSVIFTAQISANAVLIAAAPDMHRIATEQAAEIARLRDALENLTIAIMDAMGIGPNRSND